MYICKLKKISQYCKIPKREQFGTKGLFCIYSDQKYSKYFTSKFIFGSPISILEGNETLEVIRFKPPLLFSKTQFTSDKTSKIGYSGILSNFCFLHSKLSKTQFTSDKTSKLGYSGILSNFCFLRSKLILDITSKLSI